MDLTACENRNEHQNTFRYMEVLTVRYKELCQVWLLLLQVTENLISITLKIKVISWHV